MPAVTMGAYGNTRRDVRGEIGDKVYKYAYPNDLNLHPKSELHASLVSALWARANDAHTQLKKRFSSWREVDRTLTTYIDLSESEEALKDTDSRKPVSIVFPNSYAIMETMLAYMMAVFIQNPIFKYEGFDPSDTVNAILLEKLIQQHAEYNKVALNLHTMFRDNFAYGLGATAPTWRVQTGLVPVLTEQVQQSYLGNQVVGTEVSYERGIIHEGNALVNIDPYNLIVDPNVAINDFQEGEFAGWIESTNIMNLLAEEKSDPDMFNVKYVKLLKTATTSIITRDESDRGKKVGKNDQNSDAYYSRADRLNLFVKLIPSDWELDDSDEPEIWHFQLVGDSIITKCRPTKMMLDKFPMSICASEFDGYSSAPISRLEILNGLQGVLDFMFNSHVANVRKALNDMFIVDPYLVNINDLKDPKPGKLIRMRRPGWGQGVQNAVQQLNVQDITRGNMADGSLISQLMQTTMGTDNPMMGNLRSGGPERLTSAEFQGTQVGAISRLARIAQLISYQSMGDIARMFACNVQQLMERETYVRTIGAWPQKLQQVYGVVDEPIPINPLDMFIQYDVVMRDGSVPGGNFAQSWIQLYQIMATNPALMQRFDMVRVFKHIAINLGAKNVDEFEAKAVAPMINTADQQTIDQQVQAGNFVPTEEAIG